MFQQPAAGGGDKVPFGEMIGALALFVVHGHETGITTAYGEKDAVRADVHVIDGRHGGESFTDSLIFQGGLIGALKGKAGNPEPVLGRVAQAPAKPGQNPAFILNGFDEADAAIAGPAWQRIQAGQFTQPAAAAPAAAPAAAAPAGLGGVLGAPPAGPLATAMGLADDPALAAQRAAVAQQVAAPAAPQLVLPGGMTYPKWVALDPAVKGVVFPTFPPEAQALLRQTGTVPAGL